MKHVNIATLKEQLSKYLRDVEAGNEVVVTSHRRPVARLTKYGSGSPHVRASSRPASDLRKIKGVSLAKGKSSLAVLVEDRGKR
jgi:prevent-host-death family protein